MMLSIKKRLKIWKKLAQSTTTTTTTSTETDSGTDSGATTPAVAPPPNFQASAAWGWVSQAYNPSTVAALNGLISLLNMALHYSSDGKFNWLILRNNAFQVDPSSALSVDAKNLLNLSIQIYRTYINNGNEPGQKVTAGQIQNWNTLLTNSQALLNLSQMSPVGTIAQKVPGSLKENITNYLRYLSIYNPVNQ